MARGTRRTDSRALCPSASDAPALAGAAAPAPSRSSLQIPDASLEPLALDRSSTAGPPTITRRRFATFLASCRADPRRRRSLRAARGRLSGADRGVPARARRRPARRRRGARLLRGQFPPAPHRQGRARERVPHRLLRADRRRLAHADRRLQGAALPPAARPAHGGASAKAESFPNKGKRRAAASASKNVPYYDRAEIEDGALDGAHLEICWLKDPIDAFFIQIQGSARVRLEDGAMLRLNYDAHNGHPTAGRPHPDRARHRAARRDVDGPHPPMDGSQSGRRQGAAPHEQVLCVLPRHRPRRA